MQAQNGISGKQAVLAVAGSLFLSFTTLAGAQNNALGGLYMSAANVPTNLANVQTYADAPKNFDPVSASDVELATYGFPPRPDRQADPDHYAAWERAMTRAKIRWHGALKPLPGGGHTMVAAGSSSAQPAAQVQSSVLTGPRQLKNVGASGVQLTNAVTSWSSTNSFNDIWTEISVPTAELPFGSGCFNSTDLIEMSFAGIGGYILFSPVTGYPLYEPIEQGGVYTDINCVYGTTSYTAFVSWAAPNGVFSLNPGDVFYTEVQAHGPTSGSVFVEDLTTLTYNAYSVGGYPPITGNSAQWLVVRPCCTNSGNPDGMWPLPNTISIFFDGGAALNGSGKKFYPGSQATSTWILTMTDDQFSQSIELVNQGSSGYEGQHGLFFQTTGCAFTGGCTP